MDDFEPFQGAEVERTASVGSVNDVLAYYVDEEEVLGFHIWVAELELLVGNSKGQKRADPYACFELLQKLLVTIDQSDSKRVREYQRKCEAALHELLLKGAHPPIRRLISSCFVKLYNVGDSLPLYGRISSLQAFLGSKDAAGRGEETARLGCLQCLAALCFAHGQRLGSSLPESLALAIKYVGKAYDGATRAQALLLMAAVVEGAGAFDRNALALQSDAMKAAIRAAKDNGDLATKVAAARVLQSIARAGGASFWAQGGSGYEESLRLSISQLDDVSKAVGDAYATVLGELAACRASVAAQQAVAAEKRPARKTQLGRLIGDAFNACLRTPFVDAASNDRKRACTTLAQGWLAYIAAQQRGDQGDENVLVDLALQALEMLGNIQKGQGPPDGELGQAISNGELPHAQACILYILRVGVIEQLGEQGQRRFLEQLATLAATPLGSHVPLGIATLEAIGLLLEVVGEISPELANELKEPVLRKLVAKYSVLRHEAASVLMALATAEPSSAARLLEQMLAGMRNSAGTLAMLLSRHKSEDGGAFGGPGTPRGLRGPGTESVKEAMDAVHGYSLGASAVLVAVAWLPLGVPASLFMEALELARAFIGNPTSARAGGVAVEREAGYVLLGALCVCLPAEVLKDRREELLTLWGPALMTDTALALDLKRYLTSSLAGGEVVMSMEMWWRSAALEALQAFVLGPLKEASKAEGTKLQKSVVALMQPTFEAILASTALQDPNRGKVAPTSPFSSAAAMLQLRLLEVYLALPQANAFGNVHEGLIKLCARAFRGSSPSSASAGMASSVASSALRQLLNKQDAVLGPWAPGRDPVEDALQAFAGLPGGPRFHPWEAGLSYNAGVGSTSFDGAKPDSVALQPAYQPFPQPKSLGAALLEAQLVLLGNLLAVVSEANQLQILDIMIEAAAEPQQKKRDRLDASRHHAVVTSICCCALAGLDVLAKKCRGEVESRDSVAAKVGGLADAILAEAAESNDPSLQRSAAEMNAFAACIGSDSYALQLVKVLCRSMAETSSAPRRASLALAVGCIYRSKGGIALQSAVELTAQTLMAVARSCPGSVQLWVVHGLWLVANAAGLAFLPHVRASLELALQLLMSEEAYGVAGLRPAVGRLTNALVAVLGPELTLGTEAYTKCKSLIREIQSGAVNGASGPEDAFASELETVLYAQSLVLFAPQAVPAAAHLPLLLDTLTSRQPQLRQAAANTLRHLAERDPEGMLPAKLESRLFAALDSETDSAIAGQLKATLRTLLWAGCPSCPAYWLKVCSKVVLAAGSINRASSSGLSNGLSKSAGDEGGLMADVDGADDGDRGGFSAVQHVAPPSVGATDSGVSSSISQRTRVPVTPRLRTRLFAARCLLDIPVAVGEDPRHFETAHLSDKGSAAAGDWLILQLAHLIDIGFKMATGQVEALRALGLRLLKAVLRRFGDFEDPVVKGHRLLEQYQAHFVSALRSALAAGASPTLVAAGAGLASLFLQKGLATEDPVVLKRLMGLLTIPIDEWSKEKPDIYAEWVAVRAKVSLLEVHAQFATYAATCADESCGEPVVTAQAPYLRTLVGQWAALLQDYAVLGSQPPAVQAAYTPRLFDAPSPSVLPTVQLYLERAWPAALSALSSMLASSSPVKRDDVLNKEVYILLLDVCHLTIAEASTTLVKNPSGEGRMYSGRALSRAESTNLEASRESGMGPGVAMATAVHALERLLSKQFFGNGWCDNTTCAEALALLVQLVQHVLEPILKLPSPTRGQIYSSMVEVLRSTAAIAAEITDNAPDSCILDPKVYQLLWDVSKLCIRSATYDARRLSRTFGEDVAISPFQAASASFQPSDQDAELLDDALQFSLAVIQKLVEKGPEAIGLASTLRLAAAVLRSGRRGGQLVTCRRAIEKLLSTLAVTQIKTRGSRTIKVESSTSANSVENGYAELDGLTPSEIIVATSCELAALAQELILLDHPTRAVPRNGSHAGLRPKDVGHTERLGTVLPLVAIAGAFLQELRDLDVKQSPTLPGPAASTNSTSNESIEKPASRDGDAVLDSGGSDDWGDNFQDASISSENAADPANTGSIPGPPSGQGQSVGNLDDAQQASVSLRETTEPGGPYEALPGLAESQNLILQVLEAALNSASGLSIALAALHAIRGVLQRATQAGQINTVDEVLKRKQAVWALRCIAAVGGPLAVYLRILVTAQPLSGDAVQVAAEAIKLMVAALPLAPYAGANAEAAVMALFVSFVLECAAPKDQLPHAALANLAFTLLTHVAGSHAVSFRGIVASLSPGSKSRLQAVLQTGVQAEDGNQHGGASANPAQRQTIQLKNFAIAPKVE
eukprot:jgi/Botrbrau1/11524/Bobra.0393s0003.2